MSQTKIEWTDYSWNVVTGCTPVSEGCENCYAKRMATRLRGRCGYPEDEPFRVTMRPDRLSEPLSWKKPRRVFVCSMGDLFHDDVEGGFLCRVFDTIMAAEQHTFLVLTKRPKRMIDFFKQCIHRTLSNLWVGVTVENQSAADERIPILLQIPAVVRFVSCEPLLGPVDVYKYLDVYDPPTLTNPDGYNPDKQLIDWVICGGETGPRARPMHPDWVRSLRDQCQAAGVPFFFKSWGEWHESDLQPNPRGWRTYLWSDGKLMYRMGRKKAGRLLDGQEWNEYPKQYG
ncbi:MAG: hypothetical protein PWR10_1812 [Halanaerobiales bacterium]|nr:hypothetical protein [Halanaerobiales bacterium]